MWYSYNREVLFLITITIKCSPLVEMSVNVQLFFSQSRSQRTLENESKIIHCDIIHQQCCGEGPPLCLTVTFARWILFHYHFYKVFYLPEAGGTFLRRTFRCRIVTSLVTGRLYATHVPRFSVTICLCAAINLRLLVSCPRPTPRQRPVTLLVFPAADQRADGCQRWQGWRKWGPSTPLTPTPRAHGHHTASSQEDPVCQT